MPLSGRPLRTTGPILSPSTSCGHQLRSREIRTALSAAGVAAVTEGAILPEESAPCCGPESGGYDFRAGSGAAVCGRWLHAEWVSALRKMRGQTRPHRRQQHTPTQGRTRKIHLSGLSAHRRRLHPRMRSRAAFRHAQHPLDRFKIHFADVGIAPGLFGVAEGRIENASLAVHFVPRHGEIMVGSVDARVVGVVELRWDRDSAAR